MNDTTRELGAALGVAVLGSLAASRYASGLHGPVHALAPAARVTAQSSLAGALQVAESLPRAAGAALARTADLAFVDGFHLAGLVGAVLAATSAVIVVRYLPRRLTHYDAPPMDLEELALQALILDYREDEPESVAG
jgi:DHA2 family multidrug resistance protein-like MFS transporter